MRGISRAERDYYKDIAHGLDSYLRICLCEHLEGPESIKSFDNTMLGCATLNDGLRKAADSFPGCRDYLQKMSDSLPGKLRTDIFTVIEYQGRPVVIITEVKKGPVGLMEFSQLIGYCVLAEVEIGLLVTVDGSVSPDLNDILVNGRWLTGLRYRGDAGVERGLSLGCLSFKSLSKRFERIAIGGGFLSAAQLAEMLERMLESQTSSKGDRESMGQVSPSEP